jgi:penicillin-binding protein 1A
MASAFGTLANVGRHVQPTPVISVTTSDGDVIYQAPSRAQQAVEPAIAAEAVDILKGVVSSGTGVGANIGRPQFGKTGTAQNASDAWFVGAVPQMVTAVWVGFPQGQIPMCCGNVRIPIVYGGTWPASIWRTFMLAATRGVPAKEFGTDVDYVTLRVDVTKGCLANPYTPPGNIDVLRFPAGAEPTLEVCTEPSSSQLPVVPSVIGLERQAATSALHNAGFVVATVFVRSDRQPGTVIAQDPGGGSRLILTGTVTITVAKGAPEPSVAPDLAPVPNVVGMQRGAAEAAIRQAGFVASVSYERCDPDDRSCDDRQGVVWSQSPDAGAQRERGSTVTIFANP